MELIQTFVADAPKLPDPGTPMDQTEHQDPQMDRAWVVLSCVGTNLADTAPQPHRQKWYHLTINGLKVHLGDTDQVQGQNQEGPSLTAQMAESIVSGITDDQGTVPSLISITELIAPKCPQRSRSQSKRSDGKMIVVPHPYKALLRLLPAMKRCSSDRPSRAILRHLPTGTMLSGITHKVPRNQLSPPSKRRSDMLTDSLTTPGTIDDQLRRALVTSCHKKKKAL